MAIIGGQDNLVCWWSLQVCLNKLCRTGMLHNYPVRLCSLINDKQENSIGQGIYVIVFVLIVSLHLQDFIGVLAVVDLGAMWDAITHLGGDPHKINPLISQNYDHATWSSNLGTDFLQSTGFWSVVWNYLNHSVFQGFACISLHRESKAWSQLRV